MKLARLGLSSDWKDDTLIGYILYHITFSTKKWLSFKAVGYIFEAEFKIICEIEMICDAIWENPSHGENLTFCVFSII